MKLATLDRPRPAAADRPRSPAGLRLSRVFAKLERRAAEHLRPHGLSFGQFDALAHVGAAPGISQQALADALLVTKGNVCQLLGRMEAAGLLVRRQQGRTKHLSLTEAGQALYDALVPEHEALIADQLSTLSPEEQVQLLRLLRTLDHALPGGAHPSAPSPGRSCTVIHHNKECTPMTTLTTQPQTTATTWTLDPAHTLVEFSAKHMMFTTVKGRFTGLKGTIVDVADDPTQSSVEVEIDAASLTTGDPQRDAHLQSADFLDAANFPTLTFRSRRIEGTRERFKVIGDLTIRGTTREVTLDAEFQGTATNPWGKTVAGFAATTEINRKDFGLTWNVALETGGVLVSDRVKITLEVQAVKQD